MNIIVSGSLAFDRIMDFPGKFSDHILPDKIHILNVCFAINGLRENFGGTAGNIAYALALLGEKPILVAAAGKDFDPYRRWLEKHGLPTDGIRIVADELTAGAYITTDQSDNQITAFNPGAMKHRTHFDAQGLEAEESLAIIAPGNLEDMARLGHIYRKKSLPYIFDPGQSLPAWQPEPLDELIRGAYVFITNDYELELTQSKLCMSVDQLAETAEIMVTTRGECGSTVRYRRHGRAEAADIPAVKPVQVKDPTGAGDAYRAGLIKGLTLAEDDPVHAARMGSTAAAYSVEVYGTQNFVFSRGEFNARFHAAFGGKAF